MFIYMNMACERGISVACLQIFTKGLYIFCQDRLDLFSNADLTFKSQTRQGRRVNSHPPDGVDLCQLINIHCCTIYLKELETETILTFELHDILNRI